MKTKMKNKKPLTNACGNKIFSHILARSGYWFYQS